MRVITCARVCVSHVDVLLETSRFLPTDGTFFVD
jgi:hypothetical protein